MRDEKKCETLPSTGEKGKCTSRSTILEGSLVRNVDTLYGRGERDKFEERGRTSAWTEPRKEPVIDIGNRAREGQGRGKIHSLGKGDSRRVKEVSHEKKGSFPGRSLLGGKGSWGRVLT